VVGVVYTQIEEKLIRENEIVREEGVPKEYWTYFSGENAPIINCSRCMEEVKENGRPGSLAMNCWKLLSFPSSTEKLNLIKEYLSEYVKRFPSTHGKWSNRASEGRYVVVWYFGSKEEMWEARELITKEWTKSGILPIEGSYYLPYQRGGNYYEPELGHWRTWGYKYYSNLKINPENVSIFALIVNQNYLYVLEDLENFMDVHPILNAVSLFQN
jgi:hypothetical protein